MIQHFYILYINITLEILREETAKIVRKLSKYNAPGGPEAPAPTIASKTIQFKDSG